MLTSLNRLQPFGTLVMRLVLGSIMVNYGFRMILNPGSLDNITRAVAHVGLPVWIGYAVVFTESVAGLLVLAGFLTRAAAFLEAGINLAVIGQKFLVHGGNEFTFQLVCFSIALMLIFTGPGMLAVDNLFGRVRSEAPRQIPLREEMVSPRA